jgi:L-arabinokinase
LRRIATELGKFGAWDRGGGPGTVRVSRAPGRLDVMGGIADYTGALVCEGTIDRGAAVALAPRPDRQVQVFSFELLDRHEPFTLRVPLDALANPDPAALRREFDEPGRKWAGYVAGCLFALHEAGLVDLRDPRQMGLDLALHSTVPLGAGVSSSAAIEVATMMNLRDHFGLADQMDGLRVAALCQRVENAVVGAPCGVMDQVACTLGREGALLKMLCQPHDVRGFIELPPGVRVVGIDTGVRHSVGGGQYGRTRCAAFMGHRIILTKMADMGRRAGMTMTGDPMGGYLANLELEDYKRLFRQFVPLTMTGRDFTKRYGRTIDGATTVEDDVEYAVQPATDHHVHEAQRVRNFVGFLERAAQIDEPTPERTLLLDKAGHLMYASHVSYTRDARLGAPEADWIVDAVRSRERAGLYGAKITGGGLGGTIAVLLDASDSATGAIEEIVDGYSRQFERRADVFWQSGPGAFEVGTEMIEIA